MIGRPPRSTLFPYPPLSRSPRIRPASPRRRAGRGARGRGVRPTPGGVKRPGAPQHAAILGRRWRPPHARRPRRHRGAVASRGKALRPIVAVTLALLPTAAPLAAQGTALDAFRDNIAAIHARDRAAYLSH